MNNKKKPEEVKDSATKLNAEELENTSGGYEILYQRDGYITLYDDNGRRINREFSTLEEVKKYIETHKGFEKGLKEERFWTGQLRG